MMTTGDVAKYLDVSVSTVRHWVERGYLPVAWKTPTGYLKFHENDIEKVKEDCMKNGASFTHVRCCGNNETI